ncbi:alpha-amylase [Lecanosticta acicola]|uniref:alpha-amylase n=1 Tax=Lecanosticta acicola TaxID=111012 RepID=A0AAI9E8V0_9PEZI|nr:alpha-amylase [Lecanosticta acicola]
MFRYLALAALSVQGAFALSSAQWRQQSIYELITDRFALTNGSTTQPCDWGNYCGGTFQGIINHLDYIQNMGFTAIWISPVIANIDTNTPYGRPYHGYWPMDSYSINPHFGTAADLKSLSSALHQRGMYLMIDVVPNHSAWNGSPTSINFTQLNPFNQASYYHMPYCPIDYNNATSLVDCWIGDTTVSLPDLKTEDPTVQSMWNSWVSNFVANYSVDGLRIDSAMEMNKGFFPSFVSSSGVYAVGEVVNGDPAALCDYQNYMPGMTNYALYYWLQRAFGSSSATMSEITNNIAWLNSTCQDTTLLGNFIENHDNARFTQTTNDSSLIQNAIAFTILGDGIPIIYYGQEQGFTGWGDPYNREPLWPSGYNTGTTLYKFIGKINALRNRAISQDSGYSSTKANIIYSDSKTLVTSKFGVGAPVISVFNDDGAGAPSRSVTFANSKSSFGAGTAFVDIVSCTQYTTDVNGNLKITISNGAPMVLFHTGGLTGSGLCSSVTTVAPPTATPTSTAARITSPSTTFATSTTSSCTASATVVFSVNATTSWGQGVYLTGSGPELNYWNTSYALTLSGNSYPIWTVSVPFLPGRSVQYKYIKAANGAITWENGANRNLQVPTLTGCQPATVSQSDIWQN